MAFGITLSLSNSKGLGFYLVFTSAQRAGYFGADMGSISFRKIRGLLASGLCVVLSTYSTIAAADSPYHSAQGVRNPVDIFGRIEPCRDYMRFLLERNDDGVEICHPAELFVLSSSNLPLWQMIERAVSSTASSSPRSSIADTLRALDLRDPIEVFNYSGRALRQVSIELALSQDLERAVVYSKVLQEIQIEAAGAFCARDWYCGDLTLTSSFAVLLGKEFSSLEVVRLDVVLSCLFRVDAFTVPVRTVIKSERFSICLQETRGTDR